jgi:tRNA-dihydrouridine synthase 1
MIAKRGRYGAFLMEELDLLADIVSTLSRNLSIPVICKSRIYKDLDRTIRLYETLYRAGAAALTVHGRSREEKGQLVRECDFETIAKLKQHFAGRLPIIANGGIEKLEDVYMCMRTTGVDAVMSSEAILENPALFMEPEETGAGSGSGAGAGPRITVGTQLELAEEYLQLATTYPPRHMKAVRSHVQKMLHRYICTHVELRDMIGQAKTMEDFYAVCNHVRELMRAAGNTDSNYNVSWYLRYRCTGGAAGAEGGDGSNTLQAKPTVEAKLLMNLQSSFQTFAMSSERSGGEWDECGGVFASIFGEQEEDE